MRGKTAKNLKRAAYIVGSGKNLTEQEIKALYKRLKRRHSRGY